MCISWTIKGLISFMHGITMKTGVSCCMLSLQYKPQYCSLDREGVTNIRMYKIRENKEIKIQVNTVLVCMKEQFNKIEVYYGRQNYMIFIFSSFNNALNC